MLVLACTEGHRQNLPSKAKHEGWAVYEALRGVVLSSFWKPRVVGVVSVISRQKKLTLQAGIKDLERRWSCLVFWLLKAHYPTNYCS